MKNNVYAFCGGMGAGKDTYGEILIPLLETDSVLLSFSSALKDEVNFILKDKHLDEKEFATKWHITEEQARKSLSLLNQVQEGETSRSRTPIIRELLQFWGTDVRRKQDNDWWVNKTKTAIKRALKDDLNVIITDARFENEMKMLREIGSKLILLQADERERINRVFNRDGIIPSREALDHPSEQGWKNWNDYDIVIATQQYPQIFIANVIKQQILGESLNESSKLERNR